MVMGYACWKRTGDLLGATLLLLFFLPLMALLSVALCLLQGWPILYRQPRVGRQGRLFHLWKFRTMRHGHPRRLPDLPVGKHPEDPRVTPLGRLLRRFSLDELPQFVNILRGEMSLVGPRPLPVDDLEHPSWLAIVDETERARRLHWLARRHDALPGLTGQWQITPNPADDFENWIACDLDYVEHPALLADLRILARTPAAILRGRQINE